MGHGGARKGAGRKAKPIERAMKQERNNVSFDEKAVDALPELFEALEALAKGIKIATYSKPRKVKTEERYDEDDDLVYVYSVPPDKDCLRYLVDRAAGKAATKNPEAVDTELILEFTMPSIEDESELDGD